VKSAASESGVVTDHPECHDPAVATVIVGVAGGASLSDHSAQEVSVSSVTRAAQRKAARHAGTVLKTLTTVLSPPPQHLPIAHRRCKTYLYYRSTRSAGDRTAVTIVEPKDGDAMVTPW
jgi:hypothetical protein